MYKTYVIITGTSRGIGEAMANLLLEQGATVFGLARGNSEELQRAPNYMHTHIDLSDTDQIEQAMKAIIAKIGDSAFENFYLINNAAIVEPLKPIEACAPDEIAKNLQINLIAPMVLTACFIRLTEGMQVRRKILNISSGSGLYPAPDMSLYCAAKAGLNMFTRSVGLEQKGHRTPVEILAVDPGMIETEMQRTARSQPDFAMGDYFRKSQAEGKLQSVNEIAEHLIAILEADKGTGQVISYLDH